MKIYESKDIRNVGVVGHGHSGKTSLTAGLLYSTGATNRLTRVDEGNTITDFDEEEIQRKITISTALASSNGKRRRSMFWTLRASTSSSMTRGPRWSPPTRPWSWWMAWPEWKCRRKKSGISRTIIKLPRAILINKLDRERSSFDRALESVQSVFRTHRHSHPAPARRRARFQGHHRPGSA